jgi:hypothetical protein
MTVLTDNVSKICVTVLLVALLVVTAVLAWHGTLNGGDTKQIILAVLAAPALLFAGHVVANAALSAPRSASPPRLPE